MIALAGAIVLAALALSEHGFAREAARVEGSEQCKTTANGLRAAVTANDALRWAKGEVVATDLDSALTRAMTTAPVDSQGRSTGWMLELASSSGKRLHVVRFNAGEMSCDTHALEAPLVVTPINVTAETIFDLARLIKIAREAATPPPDLKKLKVSASIQQHADDSAPRWSISFVDEKGYPKGQVTIDAMTGAVVTKTPR